MGKPILIFYFIFLMLFGIGQLYAGETLFRAFHESLPAVPNAKVEDPAEWNKNCVTPGANVFNIGANGRLSQTANECAKTTKVLLPVVDSKKWTNYTIFFDIWWKDDDGVSIIFRYIDPQNYYSFTTGGTDDHYKNEWFLGPAIFTEGACFGDGGEKARLIKSGPTGVDVSNAGPFTMMVRVTDSKIECFFGHQVPQAELLNGKTPPKMVEVKDDKFKKGGIAIGTSTNPSEFANIMVIAGPLAVEAKGKIAFSWAEIRRQY